VEKDNKQNGPPEEIWLADGVLRVARWMTGSTLGMEGGGG
jgi:hypothetical protein